MFRKITLTAATALALTAGQAMSAEIETEIENFAFSFEGPFGSYDQMQLQRGLQRAAAGWFLQSAMENPPSCSSRSSDPKPAIL